MGEFFPEPGLSQMSFLGRTWRKNGEENSQCFETDGSSYIHFCSQFQFQASLSVVGRTAKPVRFHRLGVCIDSIKACFQIPLLTLVSFFYS